MSIESIISHMNDHHQNNLVDLCKKFAGVNEVKDAKLENVDLEGLDISYNGSATVRVPYPKKAKDESELKDIIIELCKSVKSTSDYSAVKEEIQNFKNEFGSVCLATLSPKGEVLCSYAPLIQTSWGDFIYISEISDHYESIKNNPNNIEVLFVEDESKASSIILRKRLRYRAKPEFMERGADFDKTFDEFEKRNGKGGGISVIRTMQDFHLIKLNYGTGSFVKGFGQAYKIDEKGELTHQGGANSSPHKMGGHGHGNPHGAHGSHSH